MEVAPVNQGHIDRRMAKFSGGIQAPESAANDDDLWTRSHIRIFYALLSDPATYGGE